MAFVDLSDAVEAIYFRLSLYSQTGYGAPTDSEDSLLDRLGKIQAPLVQEIIQSYAIFITNSEGHIERIRNGEKQFVDAFRNYYREVAPFLVSADKAREIALTKLREIGSTRVEQSLFPLLESFRNARVNQLDGLKQLSSELQNQLLGDLARATVT